MFSQKSENLFNSCKSFTKMSGGTVASPPKTLLTNRIQNSEIMSNFPSSEFSGRNMELRNLEIFLDRNLELGTSRQFAQTI